MTPALAFITVGLLVPADPHDLPVVPQPQRPRVRRLGQLPRDLHQQELGELRQLAEHLHQPPAVDRPGARRARHPRRRSSPVGARRRRFEKGPGVVSGRSSVGLFVLVVRHPVDDPRHDVQQHLVGHRRRHVWRRRSVSPSPCSPTGRRARTRAKSLIFLPMAISFIGAGIIWRFMYQAREPSPAADRRAQRGLGLGRRGQHVDDVADRSPSSSSALIGLGPHLPHQARPGHQVDDERRRRRPGSCSSSATSIYRLLGPGLGGFVDRPTAAREPSPCCSSRRRRSTTCG